MLTVWDYNPKIKFVTRSVELSFVFLLLTENHEKKSLDFLKLFHLLKFFPRLDLFVVVFIALMISAVKHAR